MERAPNLGEEIQVTNGNVYRGGCRGIPKFCPNKEILGSKWKILEGVETTNLMTFRVEEVK